MERSIYQYLKEDQTVISHLLFKFYSKIGLSDHEMMLVFHLLAFKNEGKEFPTVKELENRMSADGSLIISLLQRLVQKEYIQIKECYDEVKGILYERYDFDPLYKRIASASNLKQLETQVIKKNDKDLYTMFEKEFGRPLSPIECETLAMWIEKDKYKDELIEAALREAVVSGKLNFRYIDRILFEWQRNNIRTAEEAREFGLRFRSKQRSQQNSSKASNSNSQNGTFPFFNWLEYDSDK